MRMPWTTAALCATAVLVCGGCKGEPDPAEETQVPPELPSRHAVTGSVRYLSRVALPPDAEVHVTLEDVTRADAPATVVSEQTISTRGRQVPIRFEVPYDPARIDPTHRYTVRAEILRAGGEPLFVTTTVHPVLTGGAPTSTELVLQAAGAGGSGPGAAPRAELIETYWKLVSLDGEDAIVGQGLPEAHLVLKSKDSALVGSAGVNRMSGSYELPAGAAGSSIVLRPGAMTLMAGPEPLMKQEQRFVERLRQVDAYRVEGDRLTLSVQGRDVLVLRAVTSR